MSRKRMIKGKLYSPDTLEYWNRLLAKRKLSLDQGLDPRLGYTDDIETLEEILSTGGRKIPHKNAE